MLSTITQWSANTSPWFRRASASFRGNRSAILQLSQKRSSPAEPGSDSSLSTADVGFTSKTPMWEHRSSRHFFLSWVCSSPCTPPTAAHSSRAVTTDRVLYKIPQLHNNWQLHEQVTPQHYQKASLVSRIPQPEQFLMHLLRSAAVTEYRRQKGAVQQYGASPRVLLRQMWLCV